MKRIIGSVILLIGVCTGSLGQDIIKVTSGAVVTVQNAAALYVAGGVVLENNSTFKNDGTVIIEAATKATADLNDNSIVPYSYGTGTFIFTGKSAQNIKSSNQFERIDVDTRELSLLSNIHANTWYLKTGRVNTGLYLAIVNNASSLAIRADGTNTGFTKSWINGNLRRYITPASVDSYQFPIGDAAKTNLAEMDNMTADPIAGVTYITASFGPKPGADAGLNANENGSAYTSVNNAGVWHIIPDANPNAGKYDLKLYFNGFAGLTDNSFALLRRPEISVTAEDWTAPQGSTLPASGTPGRTVADRYARRNGVATFGQFAIGSTLSALPLQLLSFRAVKKGNTIELEWTADNEINTSHFELQRGGQNAALQYMDKVAAAGTTSQPRTYSYVDYRPLKGVSYYQLKMVDKDDRYKLSNVVQVDIEGMTGIRVYPNPVKGNFLYVDYDGGKVGSIKVIAMDGKQVPCTYDNQGDRRLVVTIPSLPAKGIYCVQVTTEHGNKNTMVTIF